MHEPSLLRLKEVQMGAHDFKYNKVALICSKTREYQYFDVCCPETNSCASKPLLLRCNLVIPQCMCQISLRLKEVQMGTHDFKYNKVPIFARKTMEYQYFDVCCPETSSCASKPLLLRCNLVIPQCMCQVLLRLKEVQLGAHDFKYNKVAMICSKTREYQYFDVCCPETSSCASKPLLLRCDLVIPQYMCQVSLGLKEVQMGAHDFQNNKVPMFLLENHGISILRCLLPRY